MTEICTLNKNAGTSISLPTSELQHDTILQTSAVQISYKKEAAPIVAYAGRYARIFRVTCTLTKANMLTLHSWSHLALTDSNFAANYPQLTADGDTYEVAFYEGPSCKRVSATHYKCTVAFIECQR